MCAPVPTIRDISSIAWDGHPVRTAKPMSFPITVEIGDRDKLGADLFYLSICNPAFLGEAAERSEWDWREQMLVLATLSLEGARFAIERKIQDSVPFASWPEFARKMAPYMTWEFAGLPYPSEA